MKEGGKKVRRRKSRESVVLIADAISESINSLSFSLSLSPLTISGVLTRPILPADETARAAGVHWL